MIKNLSKINSSWLTLSKNIPKPPRYSSGPLTACFSGKYPLLYHYTVPTFTLLYFAVGFIWIYATFTRVRLHRPLEFTFSGSCAFVHCPLHISALHAVPQAIVHGKRNSLIICSYKIQLARSSAQASTHLALRVFKTDNIKLAR